MERKYGSPRTPNKPFAQPEPLIKALEMSQSPFRRHYPKPLECLQSGHEPDWDEFSGPAASNAVIFDPLGPNPYESATLRQHNPFEMDANARSDADNEKDEDEEVDHKEDDDNSISKSDSDEDALPMIAAKCRTSGRKLKRFRLTTQQTRFLMREFANYTHPSVTQRQRLSKEIPGLSVRQVQVWFQNRRAKIKHLSADDREQLVRMQAVPENFHSVQALHPPSGATNGARTALQSSVGYMPTLIDHLIRPLKIDTSQQSDLDSMLSPGRLSSLSVPSSFAISESMESHDSFSPRTSSSSDRFFPSHGSSPISAGIPSANSSDQQHSFRYLPRARHIRSVQPLYIGDAVQLSHSGSNNALLQSSISSKGDRLDSGGHRTGHISGLNSREQSAYHPDHFCAASAQYVTHGFQGNNHNTSPTQFTHYSWHNRSSIHQPLPQQCSTAPLFSPSLDLRSYHRARSSRHDPTTRIILSTTRNGTFNHAFNSSYASALLGAPLDFISLPSTPLEVGHEQQLYDFP